jgi:hypothetical protein
VVSIHDVDYIIVWPNWQPKRIDPWSDTSERTSGTDGKEADGKNYILSVRKEGIHMPSEAHDASILICQEIRLGRAIMGG